ncbi:MAG: histidine phosphatase family protein [Pseudomonadota bacterium]
MSDLLLMRHGKSDWSLPVDDFDRPLTDRGKHDAQRVGAWLRASKLLPERVLTSPAVRARATAEKCVKAAGLTVEIIEAEPRLYEAGSQDIRKLLTEQITRPGRLLVVGHNPGLDLLLDDLVPGPLPLTPSGKLMTTASLAHLQIDRPGLRASLLRLLRPDDLPTRFTYQGPDGPALRDRPDYYYQQSAVIPVRLKQGEIEVLMIAKSGKRKWSLPKGIIEPGLSPWDSAAREALEEAGATGTPLPTDLGTFEIAKWGGTCQVAVYVMPVDTLLPDTEWESQKRVRRWFPLQEAVRRCRYPALAAIIGQLEQGWPREAT